MSFAYYVPTGLINNTMTNNNGISVVACNMERSLLFKTLIRRRDDNLIIQESLALPEDINVFTAYKLLDLSN